MSSFAPSALPQVAPPDPTKHVNYALGMVLGVDDFTQEYANLSGHDQRNVRNLIGYGVISGLRVTIDVDAERGPRVQVAPGEAVVPSGRSVCISPAQCAYLNDWLHEHRNEVEALGSPPDNVSLSVVACYRECPTDEVPIPGEPCRTDAELREASRLAESFELELRLAPAAQLEEDAVRDFVAWVRSLPVTSAAGVGIDVFLDTIRAAADLEGSPPASPPTLLDFLLGSPPAGLAIPADDADSYYAALLRFWIEELRPRLRSAAGAECGCGGGGVGELDKDADCITLAELEVPIAVDGISGAMLVADTPDVTVDDTARPTLLHLRMLQELLFAVGAQRQAGIEGRVEADGTVAGGSGPLTVTVLENALYLVDFPGFDELHEQIVLGQSESEYAAPSPSTFDVIPRDDVGVVPLLGSPPADGVVVRSLRFDGTAAPFSVRIVQLGAAT